MNRFQIALVLCPSLAVSAWSQTTTLPTPTLPCSVLSGCPPAFPLLRQFLGLTDDQVSAILRNNSDYNSFSFQQQDQIRHAQSQIAIETAKDPLDPMALGTLYAGIESACRELRDRAASSQQQNISVLTDAQKAKLNVLNDAMKLIPTISEAQSGNLLGSANSPPFAFSAYSSSFAYVSAGFSSGVPGCAVNGGFGALQIPPPPQTGDAGLNTTPAAPANRIVNKWFNGDFVRIPGSANEPGSLGNLTQPQTKTQ
jgi:hypothetical protein